MQLIRPNIQWNLSLWPTWEIGTTWELRTATAVPKPITQSWTWEIRPPQNWGQFFTVPCVSLISKFHCIWRVDGIFLKYRDHSIHIQWDLFCKTALLALKYGLSRQVVFGDRFNYTLKCMIFCQGYVVFQVNGFFTWFLPEICGLSSQVVSQCSGLSR